MKVLLDECVPERLREHLTGHEIHTVRYAGFSGKKNGELLRLAEEAGYDVLLTVDQGIPYQHRMSGRRISIIVLRAPGNDIDTLKRMTAAAIRALTTIAAGEIIEVEHSATSEN
jgi:predicted nuclease of predicted toxin-antitoxin system